MQRSHLMADQNSRELAQNPEGAGVTTDPEGLTALERKLRAEEIATRRRFSQNAAMALVFAMAALTLVVIVRSSP